MLTWLLTDLRWGRRWMSHWWDLDAANEMRTFAPSQIRGNLTLKICPIIYKPYLIRFSSYHPKNHSYGQTPCSPYSRSHSPLSSYVCYFHCFFMTFFHSYPAKTPSLGIQTIRLSMSLWSRGAHLIVPLSDTLREMTYSCYPGRVASWRASCPSHHFYWQE